MKKAMLGEESLATRDVNKILGIHLSVDELKACGVSPFVETYKGVYWRKRDIPVIAYAVGRKLMQLAKSLEEPTK